MSAEGGTAPRGGYRWIVVVLLFFAITINYIDRAMRSVMGLAQGGSFPAAIKIYRIPDFLNQKFALNLTQSSLPLVTIPGAGVRIRRRTDRGGRAARHARCREGSPAGPRRRSGDSREREPWA